MIEVETVKVSKYKNKPIRLYYRIRSDTGRDYLGASPNWSYGSIRLDLTEFYSATFKASFKLSWKEDKAVFTHHVNGELEVCDEIVELANRITTEHYLLEAGIA